MAWSPMMRAAGPGRHDHHPVGECDRLLQVVGDEQHGLAVAGPQLEQQVAHDLPGLGVERPERLVHQQDVRIADQHLGKADALPLAARELVGIAVAERGKPDALEPGLRSLEGLGPGDTSDLEADGDVVARRLPRHDRVLLEKVAGVAVEAGEALAQHEGLAGGGDQQPGRHVEEGGLAATRGADDGDELVGADGEVGGGDGRVAATVGQRELDRHAAECHGRSGGVTLGGHVGQRAISLSGPAWRGLGTP